MRPITGNGPAPGLSYYSKGPFVAYLIALSTSLGGRRNFVACRRIALAGTTIGVLASSRHFFDARLALATAIFLHLIPLFAAGALS
jgi:4-amino-4-deoxy-L-arabinose transferase-like glycosyltransferase